MNKVILVGYMGSGKTQVGRFLASVTGLPFIDLDEKIQSFTKMTIPELFSHKGEIYFRKIEHQLWKELMESKNSFVLSTGGGAPCYANNHEFLHQEGVCSVYLKTSIAELTKRLESETGQRPLLQQLGEEPLSDYIAKHLFDRSYFYHQSKHIVSTDTKTPEAIVQEILELMQ
jgi:shikimate kinase